MSEIVNAVVVTAERPANRHRRVPCTVRLADGREASAMLSGWLLDAQDGLGTGSAVSVELSPFDERRARIVSLVR